MGVLAFVAVLTAWAVAFLLAKKWQKGLLAFAAAFAGMVATWIITIGIAILISTLNEEVFPVDDALLRAIGISAWSFLISPVAAFSGWRKGKAQSVNEEDN